LSGGIDRRKKVEGGRFPTLPNLYQKVENRRGDIASNAKMGREVRGGGGRIAVSLQLRSSQEIIEVVRKK